MVSFSRKPLRLGSSLLPCPCLPSHPLMPIPCLNRFSMYFNVFSSMTTSPGPDILSIGGWRDPFPHLFYYLQFHLRIRISCNFCGALVNCFYIVLLPQTIFAFISAVSRSIAFILPCCPKPLLPLFLRCPGKVPLYCLVAPTHFCL